MTSSFDASDFWEDSDYARETYVEEPLTEELVRAVEAELGYRLPRAYVAFMRHQNGGIPKRSHFPTDRPTSWAEDHVAIAGFLGIGRSKPYSLIGEYGNKFSQREWGYPNFGVYICDCPSGGHDMVMLDYRASGPDGEPTVVHVDQELDYRITPLAPSFDAFVRRLVHKSVYDRSADDFADALERIRTGSFSTLLSRCIADCARPRNAEASLRRMLESTAVSKGYFALHDDARSHLVYDALFHLYASSPRTKDPANFVEAYPDLLAFGDGEITTGGYAPSFIESWWENRVKTGAIAKRKGRAALTGSVRRAAIEALELG